MRGERGWNYLRFALGFLLAASGLLASAESFLKLFPPQDLQPFLGEASTLTGQFCPDDDFGANYRSWEAFCAENPQMLAYLPLVEGLPRASGLPQASGSETRPVWAFFGNSFVQAPGMLADCARQEVPDRAIFNLGRNEPLNVRLAQIKTLLDVGMRPERIFVVLMPVDVIDLGEQPLATIQVTGGGAIGRRPRLPPGAGGWLVDHSRLALTAWVRSGRHRGNPAFDKRRLYEHVDEQLLGDLERMFGSLARLARRRDVPVTVVLIPAWHQVCKGASFVFQDKLAAIFRQQGLDVLDPREAFCRSPRPHDLFLPDKHFNAEGNGILLSQVRRHAEDQQQLARGGGRSTAQ